MAISDGLRELIEHRLQDKILSIRSVPGGDINQSFCLSFEGHEKDFFLKFNDTEYHKNIIISEAKALGFFMTHDILTPEVSFYSTDEQSSFLMMEFISGTKTWTEKSIHSFAASLAKLHSVRNDKFGWHENNCIGSLPQINTYYNDFIDYYWQSRIEVQIRLAIQNTYLDNDSSYDYMIKRLEQIPKEEPVLIHGDLWVGNYLINENEEAVLIDPSCSFGHREMDLAMMQLFGGFPEEVFDQYKQLLPLRSGWESRSDLFQLYYLLVHLNIFGGGYLHSVKHILDKYRW